MLDRFLQALSDPNAQELRLASGSAPTLIYSEGPQPISTSQPTTAELIDLLAGVLTIDQVQQLKQAGQVEADVTDYGTIDLHVTARLNAGMLEAAFTRMAAPEVPPANAFESFANAVAEPRVDEPGAPRLELDEISLTDANEDAQIEKAFSSISETPAPEMEPAQAVTAAEGVPDWDALLEHASQCGASDIHVIAGEAPRLRVANQLVTADRWKAVSAEQIQAQFDAIAPEKARRQFASARDVEFACDSRHARFRISAYADRNGLSLAMRLIPLQIRSAEQLGIPAAVLEACHQRDGLIFVTGRSSSGKSSTVAALIHHLNSTSRKRIVTLENPIETVHENDQCVVHQRELSEHTASIAQALQAAHREDPDVLVVGELSNAVDLAAAIDFADAGHLVIATMSVSSGVGAIERLLDSLPGYRADQLRGCFASALRVVTSQVRVHGTDGQTHVAYEVLTCTPAVASLIRDGKIYQLPAVIQSSSKLGMTSMNDELVRLVREKKISAEQGMTGAGDRAGFQRLLEQAGIELGAGQPEPTLA